MGGGPSYPGGNVPFSSHSCHCVAVAVGSGAGAGAVAPFLVCRYSSYSDDGGGGGACSRIVPVRGRAGRFAASDGRGLTYDAGAIRATNSMLMHEERVDAERAHLEMSRRRSCILQRRGDQAG